VTATWAAIGWPRRMPRWWLPRGPAAVTAAAVGVHRPLAGRATAAWLAARAAARLGVFRFAPRGPAPPTALEELLAPHVPAGGAVAVMRSNHPDRYLALVLDPRHRPQRVAKLALSGAGERALAREAEAMDRYAGRLGAPLSAPRLLAAGPGLLVTAAVTWRLRRRPWYLAPEVAAAIGRFHLAGAGPHGGLAHGDFAPWNLLHDRDGHGQVLVDWEEAGPAAPPYTDVFHFLVQSHVLLGRPAAGELLAGVLGGHGWVGAAVHAYRHGADLDGDPAGGFERYLRASAAELDPGDGPQGAALVARRRLLARMRGGAAGRAQATRSPR
jgi:phosphotransferase family enzyme